MFTIRGRLVCLTIRVRPSTQDVDELGCPHFVYIGAWFCRDLRVDGGAYKNNIINNETMVLISFILKILVACLCYSIAKGQGRSPGLAAVLGFIFGLFALIGYCIAGKKKQKDVSS